jgi:hypothetical protein
MPCLVVILAFLCPRIVLLCLWLFTKFPADAFAGRLWPVIGFFLMPYTTLAYMGAKIWAGGLDTGWGIVLMIAGIAIDLGVLRGSRSGDSKDD